MPQASWTNLFRFTAAFPADSANPVLTPHDARKQQGTDKPDSQAPVSHLVGLECQASTGTGHERYGTDCGIELYRIKVAALCAATCAGLGLFEAHPGTAVQLAGQ